MRQCPYWSLLHRWEPFVLILFYFLVRLLYLAYPLSMMLSFRRFLQLSFHEHRFHIILFPFLQIMTPLLGPRSEEHTSELQSRFDLVCRLLLEKKKYTSLEIMKD